MAPQPESSPTGEQPPPRPGKQPAQKWRPLLRRADQSVVGGIVFLALLGMAFSWWQASRRHGGLIEIDRTTRKQLSFQVDLNQADWPELAQLPDIGETLARRIVESRATDGPFKSVEDLDRVRGIGPLTLERLRPYLIPLPATQSVAGTPDLSEFDN